MKSADACAQIPYLHVFHALWCVKSIIKTKVQFEFAQHYTLYDVDLGDISACKRTGKAHTFTKQITDNQLVFNTILRSFTTNQIMFHFSMAVL